MKIIRANSNKVENIIDWFNDVSGEVIVGEKFRHTILVEFNNNVPDEVMTEFILTSIIKDHGYEVTNCTMNRSNIFNFDIKPSEGVVASAKDGDIPELSEHGRVASLIEAKLNEYGVVNQSTEVNDYIHDSAESVIAEFDGDVQTWWREIALVYDRDKLEGFLGEQGMTTVKSAQRVMASDDFLDDPLYKGKRYLDSELPEIMEEASKYLFDSSRKLQIKVYKACQNLYAVLEEVVNDDTIPDDDYRKYVPKVLNKLQSYGCDVNDSEVVDYAEAAAELIAEDDDHDVEYWWEETMSDRDFKAEVDELPTRF